VSIGRSKAGSRQAEQCCDAEQQGASLHSESFPRRVVRLGARHLSRGPHAPQACWTHGLQPPATSNATRSCCLSEQFVPLGGWRHGADGYTGQMRRQRECPSAGLGSLRERA
jgi:hypothetical protein